MFKRNQYLNVAVAILTVVLICAYALIAFFPHAHGYAENDCSVCALIELSRTVFIGIALSASFRQSDQTPYVLLHTYSDVFVIRDSTPVGLKVKLSD